MKKLLTIIIIIGIIAAGMYFTDTKPANLPLIGQFFENENNSNQDNTEKIVRKKEEKSTSNGEKIYRNPLKEVGILDLSKEKPELKLQKSGISASKIIAYISPEIAGKITSIKVEVGDEVNEDQTLIKLGDSVSTSVIDAQYDSAIKGQDLAEQSKEATQDANDISLQAAELAAKGTVTAYNNSVANKANTKDLLRTQVDSAELAHEAAEQNYKNLKKQYKEAKSLYEDAEEGPIKDQLESTVDQLKAAKDNAKIATDQAEIGIEQANENYQTQLKNLNFAIKNAKIQCQASLIQIGSTKAMAILQELQAEGQIIQAETNTLITSLSKNAKQIKSPIQGIVTSITAKEDNFASPGQVLMKIENNSTISIKTSINQEEAKFISINDSVEIILDNSGEESITGKIVSISPTLDEMSKKINVEIETKATKSLKPGSFVKVIFQLNTRSSIFIPLNSIFLADQNKYVWVVKNNGTIKKQKVSIGEIFNEYAEINSGLNGNEKIVKTSQAFLKEGEKVTSSI